MIRHLAALLAGALWLSGCSAPDPLADHDWPDAAPALWEVTSPAGETGWLFGTVHALPDGLNWQTPAVDTAAEQSGLLLVEIADLGASSSSADIFAALSSSPALPPLLDRVGETDRPSLQRLLDLSGADESDFDRTETWAAALILSGAMRNGDPANGVDRALISGARRVEGLESYDQQYRIFDALPEVDQADLLLAVAGEAEGFDPVPALESWLTGELDTLAALADDGMLADPGLRAALLDRRNQDWTVAIRAAIDQGHKPLVAVGTAHMLGTSGLPALLEQQGYAVRRIQ